MAVTTADISTCYLAFGADTFPGGTTSLGTFESSAFPSLINCIQEVLGRTSKANPALAALFPDNITSTQFMTITRHGPAINATSLTGAAISFTRPATPTAVVKYQPADTAGTNTDFTWTTSDAAKATVSTAGVITGVAAGAVTITATHKYNGYAVGIAVTVI